MEALVAFLKAYVKPGIWVYLAGTAFFGAGLFLPESVKSATFVGEISKKYIGLIGVGFWLFSILLFTSIGASIVDHVRPIIHAKKQSATQKRLFRSLSTEAKVVVFFLSANHTDKLWSDKLYRPTRELFDKGIFGTANVSDTMVSYYLKYDWEQWVEQNGPHIRGQIERVNSDLVKDTIKELKHFAENVPSFW